MTDGGPHEGQPIEVAGAPRGAATSAVVMLPGRGDSPRRFLRLAEEFHRHGAAYVAPEPAGKAWYPGPPAEPPEAKEPWLSSAFRLVERAMSEAEAAGVPPERTVLLGFSQGACVAAEFAAANPRRYGGLAVLAGGLFGPDPAKRSFEGSLAGTPTYVGCGDDDARVEPERVRATATAFRRLDAAGVPPAGRRTASVDADVTEEVIAGLGHAIGDEQVAAVRRLVGGIDGRDDGGNDREGDSEGDDRPR